MLDGRNSSSRSSHTPTHNSGLDKLTAIPANIVETFLPSLSESQAAIATAVQEAIDAMEISVYELHERTGLSCDLIDSILEATYDLQDSQPIQALEQALQVRLSHL